jgi:hypothetical protein
LRLKYFKLVGEESAFHRGKGKIKRSEMEMRSHMPRPRAADIIHGIHGKI